MTMSIVVMKFSLLHCRRYHLFGDNSQLLLFNKSCISFVGPSPFLVSRCTDTYFEASRRQLQIVTNFRWYKYNRVEYMCYPFVEFVRLAA